MFGCRENVLSTKPGLEPRKRSTYGTTFKEELVLKVLGVRTHICEGMPRPFCALMAFLPDPSPGFPAFRKKKKNASRQESLLCLMPCLPTLPDFSPNYPSLTPRSPACQPGSNSAASPASPSHSQATFLS